MQDGPASSPSPKLFDLWRLRKFRSSSFSYAVCDRNRRATPRRCSSPSVSHWSWRRLDNEPKRWPDCRVHDQRWPSDRGLTATGPSRRRPVPLAPDTDRSSGTQEADQHRGDDRQQQTGPERSVEPEVAVSTPPCGRAARYGDGPCPATGVRAAIALISQHRYCNEGGYTRLGLRQTYDPERKVVPVGPMWAACAQERIGGGSRLAPRQSCFFDNAYFLTTTAEVASTVALARRRAPLL